MPEPGGLRAFPWSVSGAEAGLTVSPLTGNGQRQDLSVCNSHTGNSSQTGRKVKEDAGRIKLFRSEYVFMTCRQDLRASGKVPIGEVARTESDGELSSVSSSNNKLLKNGK